MCLTECIHIHGNLLERTNAGVTKFRIKGNSSAAHSKQPSAERRCSPLATDVHNSWSSVVEALNGRHPLTPTSGRSNRFSPQTAPHLLCPDRNGAAGPCREAHVCDPNERDAIILAALLNQVLGVKSSGFRRKENWKF